MDLEIINKLYLELSQVATAETSTDLKMRKIEAICNKYVRGVQSNVTMSNCLQEIIRLTNA